MLIISLCSLLGIGCPKPDYIRYDLPHVADYTYYSEGVSSLAVDAGVAMLARTGYVGSRTGCRDCAQVRIYVQDCSDNPARVARAHGCGDIGFCAHRKGGLWESGPSFAHELAHAMGFGHVEGGLALMNAKQDPGAIVGFTSVDVGLFRAGATDPFGIFAAACKK